MNSFDEEVIRLQKSNRVVGYNNAADTTSMVIPDGHFRAGASDVPKPPSFNSKIIEFEGESESIYAPAFYQGRLQTPSKELYQGRLSGFEGSMSLVKVPAVGVSFKSKRAVVSDMFNKQIDDLARAREVREARKVDNLVKVKEGFNVGSVCFSGCDKAEKAQVELEKSRNALEMLRSNNASRVEIARLEADVREKVADVQRQIAEANFNYLKQKSTDEKEIRQAEFERDEALAEYRLRENEAAEATARAESDNKRRIEEEREDTNREINRNTNQTAQELGRLKAQTDQEIVRQTAESERVKLNNTAYVDLANTAAQLQANKDDIEGKLRKVTIDAELTERLRVSDNAVKLEARRIEAGVEQTRSQSENAARTQLALIENTNSVALTTGKAVAAALKITMPNGIEGILGESNKIVKDITTQNARMATEQARLNATRDRLQQEQQLSFTNNLLEMQRQERIQTLKAAEEESLRSQRMMAKLQEQADLLKNEKKPSEILSKLVSNVVVESIMKCQSTVKMNQTIGGAGGKIVIGGKNNTLNVTQKQVVSFAADCGQDINSIIAMQSKIVDTVKDFIQLQAKTTILGMEKLPTQYGSDIKTEAQNLFDSKAITEILADFEASQSVSNIEITGEGNQAVFNQDQALDILIKSAQKVANQLEIIGDLEKNADKQAIAAIEAEEDIFTPINIGLVLVFLLIIILSMFYYSKKSKTDGSNLLLVKN